MNHDLHIRDLPKRLAAGTDSVAFELDRIYRHRLCSLVDKELHQIFKRRQDPEDIVQSVFKSFYRRASSSEFCLEDVDSLWPLLQQVARNKLRKRIAKDKAHKRSILRERPGEYTGELPAPVDDGRAHVLGEALENALSQTESPQSELFRMQLFGYDVDEVVNIVLEGLDSHYARILQLRLQGSSESQIGKRLGCGREAVRYKLKRIQQRLQHVLGQQSQ